MTWVNSTVAMSAAPIGRPGWPDLAASTASIESARIALVMRSWCARFMSTSSPGRMDGAAAAVDVFAVIGAYPDARWIACKGLESNVRTPPQSCHAQAAKNAGITKPDGVDGNVA